MGPEGSVSPDQYRKAEEYLKDTTLLSNPEMADGKTRLQELSEAREDAIFEGKRQGAALETDKVEKLPMEKQDEKIGEALMYLLESGRFQTLNYRNPKQMAALLENQIDCSPDDMVYAIQKLVDSGKLEYDEINVNFKIKK